MRIVAGRDSLRFQSMVALARIESASSCAIFQDAVDNTDSAGR